MGAGRGTSGLRRPGRRALGWAALWLVGLAAGCDTEELLKVDLPGQVTEEKLDNAQLAQILTNSVVIDVECAWNVYVAAAAVHSDNYIQSSANSTNNMWATRNIGASFTNYATSTCDSNYGIYTGLHTARVQAISQAERIQGFPDAVVPNKAALLARIKAYGGYTYLAFAESFCGTPLKGGGPTAAPSELFRQASEMFSEAIQLAGATAGLADVRNLALVGRARAKLGLQDYPGVIADASLVPAGFLFNVTRDESPGRRQNALFRGANGPPGGQFPGQRHASVAPGYRDVRWKGVKDPRVTVTSDGVSLGFDFSTVHWRSTKVNAYSTPVMLASYREAQMFIAEAAAMTGDLDRARTILNSFHTAAGIPALTAADVPTQDDVIRQVIEERRREFFIEGGHRLRDHLRWRGTKFQVPFLGEPGSDHPNGVDQSGAPYGTTTCVPVPTVELG